jgi:hypothetical protein
LESAVTLVSGLYSAGIISADRRTKSARRPRCFADRELPKTASTNAARAAPKHRVPHGCRATFLADTSGGAMQRLRQVLPNARILPNLSVPKNADERRKWEDPMGKGFSGSTTPVCTGIPDQPKCIESCFSLCRHAVLCAALSGSHRAAGSLLAQRNGPANWDGSYKKPRKERRPKPTTFFDRCSVAANPNIASGGPTPA